MCDRNEPLDLESAEKLLKVERHIESTISQFFKWKATLREICSEVKNSQEFNFVSISLVSLEQNIIESSEGIGCVTSWLNIAKHYLEEDETIRDIQADVYYTKKTEIITGFDERFDEWLYTRYGHDKFTRVFTPILLVRDGDDQGRVSTNWQEQCQWEVLSNKTNEKGSTTSLKLKVPDNLVVADVIAVIEAGYENSERPITEKQGIELANFVGQYSQKIYEIRLSYILEVIAQSAVELMEADSATLNFLPDHSGDKYIYNVCAGNIGHIYLQQLNYFPRKDGLGKLAVDMETYQSASTITAFKNQNKVSLNPKCKEDGIISSIAFPLIIEKDSKRYGFLCIHYKKKYDFRNKTILGQFYAERAVNIIANVLRYKSEKEKVNQLKTLHSVASSIANPPDNIELLPYIASNILNVLAADVVNIYEYDYFEKKFNKEPYIAGKLILKNDTRYDNVSYHYVLHQLFEDDNNLKNGSFLLIESLNQNHIFRDSKFAREEKIYSVACVKLEINSVPIGLMFINYRRPHVFSDEEKDLIKILASSSALAIKNKWDLDSWLTAWIGIERQLMTTLDRDKLLELIVKEAVNVTHAKVGDIFLREKIDQRLIRVARYPGNILSDSAYEQIDIGVGIIGKVAEKREPLIIDDVNNTKHSYIPYYKGLKMRSELCVPIIYSDNTIIGVINLESDRLRNFKDEHKSLLKAIANQAAIALHNTSTNKKLIATEKMAILGDLSSSLVHELSRNLGLIQIYAKDISSRIRDSKLDKITDLTNKINQEITAWKAPIDDEITEAVSIILVIYEAIDKITKEQQDFLKDITISISPDIDSSESFDFNVCAGKLLIREIFINLLRNAKESIAEKTIASGAISVDCSSFNLQSNNKQWLKIIVQDNGKGIEQDKISKVFEHGYSTKNRQDSRKRGFGLWWTQIFVERLGGQIKAYNLQGGGAKFIIVLPKFDF